MRLMSSASCRAYRDVPDFLNGQHRITNAADADAYVARVEAFGSTIDAETERQREDAAKGSSPRLYPRHHAQAAGGGARQSAEATGPAVDIAAKLKAANLPLNGRRRLRD